MSEFELLQLQNEYNEAFASMVMNFISILSGFLLANHFLGSKINSVQFLVMLLTYTVVMLVTAAGVYIAILNFESTERALAELSRSWPSNQKVSDIDILVSITLLVTYLGSLLFAFTSRGRQSRMR